MKHSMMIVAVLLSAVALCGQSITVISPNGGEEWQKGSFQQIMWTSSGITSGTYQVTLWRGGSSLGVVATGLPYNVHSFNWEVGELANAAAAEPGSGYLIKVRLQGEPANDFSDGAFTITSPAPTQSITVISPNGGEEWQKGTTRNITWTTSGISSGTYQVTLWRGGSNLGVVATGLPYNVHSFNWEVGELANAAAAEPGNGYLIKVRLQGEPANDFSDAPFTITAPSHILNTEVDPSPGGEGYQSVFAARPDMEIVKVVAIPDEPSLDEPTVFRVFIRNHNDSAECKPCHMNIRMLKHENGGQRTVSNYQVEIPGLKPGKTAYKKDFQYLFQEAGNYTLKLLLDSHDVNREQNENNNAFSFSENLDNIRYLKPELVFTDFWHMQHVDFFEETQIWGTIRNVGEAASGPFNLEVMCSPNKKKSQRVKSLLPGMLYKFSFTFKWNTVGTKQIGAWVDKDNEVDEQNEDNNHVRSSIRVVSGTVFD